MVALRGGWHPAAVVEGHVIAFSTDQTREPVSVQLRAPERALLVVAGDVSVDRIRRAVQAVDADGRVALVTVLVALAHGTGQALDDLVGDVQRLDVEARGYTSAPQRRQMAHARSRLFGLQELEATQHRLLAPEEELSQALPESARRLLRQAAMAFDDNRATAGRLYAMLGDLLTQQSSVLMERLTLVSTIFLPLTLGTGFFGMNFAWMTDRIGTLPAFVLLGILSPMLLTAVTLVLIRRLSAPT